MGRFREQEPIKLGDQDSWLEESERVGGLVESNHDHLELCLRFPGSCCLRAGIQERRDSTVDPLAPVDFS